MDNELYKELIKDLLIFIRQFCPASFAKQMFQLENRAKKLGIE